MIREFPLPDLGEGLTESEIVAWRVAVGDRVELNQIIADVETAKAVVELPSPYSGVITALYAAEGETVNVGEPLFSCDTGEDAAEGSAPDAPEAAAAAPETPSAAQRETAPERDAAPGPNLVGYGARDEGGPKRRARRAALVADLVPPVPDDSDAAPDLDAAPSSDAGAAGVAGVATPTDLSTGAPERPRSTPPVRKLARDLGVDLAEVTGTGERGLITRADVEAAASGPQPGVEAASWPVRDPSRPPGRDAHPHQGRAQAHRRRDGAQRLHRAACDGVPHRRRHRDDGAPPRHPRRSRLRRPQGDAAHRRREGRVHRGSPHARGELAVGRPGAGDRAVRGSEPRHRRGDRARASWFRTSRGPSG